MTNAVQFTTPPNPTVTPAAGPAPAEVARKESPQRERSGGQLADLRLVIEESEDGQGFIYKTLDRRTGEIVQVYPRDEVLKMGETAEYHPGTVVDQRT
ncbi:MAG: hypothetical protein J0I28_09555 [Caulobacterales bacterium]|nr:hypothetical protein [Caulobacterales bacterium]